MADQAAAPEGAADGGGAGQAAPAFDPAVFQQGFEELRTGMEGLRQEFSQSRQPAEPEAEEEFDLSFLDGSDPEIDPAAQRQAMEQWQQQLVQQASAPAMQAMARLQEMQMQQEAAALVADFPELGQPETAQNVVGAAHEFAQQLIPSLGLDQIGLSQQQQQQIAQRLGDSPGAWRMAYMASKADAAARGEGDAGDATFIEGGTGPGPGAPQQDPADLIVGARGSSVLPF